MIQLKSLLNCIDNSGASVVECVNVLKKKRAATIGDRIVVVVQKQRAAGSEGTGTTLANKVRRGDIRHAVIVRVKKELQRVDGTVVRFGDNACVLVNKSGDPIGTRMNGACFESLSSRGPMARGIGKSLATEIATSSNADTFPGVVGQELRGKQWSKILSLAPVHV
ncbi:54S ribosomal protein L38 [Penicillium argentinense]|uniref:Large ribosomal subunit protein uL14m n=1 Tax=Penicillium argentinense TaxID=1131581 RepID=A0A9W9FMT3_9EURO|nr:54S ribosomal protein L38 [Penicillium argentinense]KAJ5103054.1 54S ribosomal protein L38 [Penicillium argentinense]